MIKICKNKYKQVLCYALLILAVLTDAYAQESNHHFSKATFAGGCFWHLDSAFVHQEGIIATQVGFTGGKITVS